MGRVFFNPNTGEYWKANWAKKKPPEGFEPIDLRCGRRLSPCPRARFFCHKCNEYHPVIHLCRSRLAASCEGQPERIGYCEMPLHKRMLLEYGSKYGCEAAEKIIDLGMLFGGWERHYMAAEKLVLAGCSDEEIGMLKRLPAVVRGWALKEILNGAALSEVLGKAAISVMIGAKSPLEG